MIPKNHSENLYRRRFHMKQIYFIKALSLQWTSLFINALMCGLLLLARDLT
jgi:hypothetical protein